ncbi:MAG TPA: homocysteine S-methyltransferase family protein [Chthoniobacterales bacterium]|nr:homocysteine S-methyltransferase family protein [Chthoniobacterales bacterium]
MDLLGELGRRVVCGDGAMGTTLLNAGLPIERCFEELSMSQPERIRKIHEDYIAAGAEVIKTNTFGGNEVRLGRFGLENRVAEINGAAVAVARSAAAKRDLCIAGSVGPLGINAEEAAARGIDRDHCFREQITALLEAGTDVIFFETFTTFEEMEIALRSKNTIGAVPEICSFACEPHGRLRCGTALSDAFAKLQKMGARMVGVNCMNSPQEMAALLQHVPLEGPLAIYPSAGIPKPEHGCLKYEVTPESFAGSSRHLVANGARLLGGCCGTTPAHVAALVGMIRDLKPR